MLETLLLAALLVAPLAMIAAAVRIRRAREVAQDAVPAPPSLRETHVPPSLREGAGGGSESALSATARPWDKSFRNAMLLGLAGVLLAGSGLYAFSAAAGTSLAPVFALPVIAGVVLLAAAYRTWMRGVSQVPD